VYPQLSLIGPGAAPRGLVSDVAAGDWHITGSVIEQSGFGVFLDCQLLDASRFVGLAFSISGDVGNAGSVTLLVGTASNDVSSEWLIENGGDSEPRSGRCVPEQTSTTARAARRASRCPWLGRGARWWCRSRRSVAAAPSAA
jgi:hypothetical protein